MLAGALKLLLLLLFIQCCSSGVGCTENHGLLIVSTLDGAITALDQEDGSERWRFRTDDLLVSHSSISDLHIVRDGREIKLIPSLGGGLYQFDGESFRYFPLRIEALLSRSQQLGESMLASGEVATAVYGVNLHTGELLYMCEAEGCKRSDSTGGVMDADVLIFTRRRETLRAVDIRYGSESWNYSVTHFDVLLRNGGLNATGEYPVAERSGELNSETQQSLTSTFVTVAVAERKVVVRETLDSGDAVRNWERAFDVALAQIWHVSRNGRLRKLNSLESCLDGDGDGELPPATKTDRRGRMQTLRPADLLYLGSYSGQMYVNGHFEQASELHGKPSTAVAHWQPYIGSAASRTPVLQACASALWRFDRDPSSVPYPFDAGSCLLSTDNVPLQIASDAEAALTPTGDVREFLQQRDDSKTMAIVIPMPRANLPPAVCENDSCDTSSKHASQCPAGDMTPQWSDSLWSNWPSLLSVFAFVLLTNLLLSFVRPAQKLVVLHKVLVHSSDCPPQTPQPQPLLAITLKRPVSDAPEDDARAHKVSESLSTNEFASRYEIDYEHDSCLGWGGFGVVFKARNRIDDQFYAVKRITLRGSARSRDRMMREVKCLAKLDHPNVVRFYQAWCERPPSSWQTARDHHLLRRSASSPASDFDQPDSLNELLANTSNALSDSHALSTTHDASSDNNSNDATDTRNFRLPKRNAADSVDIVFTRSRNSPSKAYSTPSETHTSDKETESHAPLQQDPSLQQPLTREYLYIQMQLCNESLKDWLVRDNEQVACRRKLTPASETHLFRLRDRTAVLNYFEQITNAVCYIHQAQLIHRDLKPSNILFSLDGRVIVGDFGLVTAQLADEHDVAPADRRANASGHTREVGTQTYMSPEQRNGHAYDEKVDIYALGIILFELLHPFSTEMERAMLLTDAKRLVFPRLFTDELPYDCALLQRMLAHSPVDRPSSKELLSAEPLLDVRRARAKADCAANSLDTLPSMSQVASNASMLNDSHSGSSSSGRSGFSPQSRSRGLSRCESSPNTVALEIRLARNERN